MRFDRFKGVTKRDQVELWRAAARGALADGDATTALRWFNVARMIEGKPPRVRGVGRVADRGQS